MLRYVLAAALSVAMAASAQAANCYLEGSAGKNVTATRLSDDIAGPVTISADGLQGGVGVGCQMAMPSMPRLILGIGLRYDLQDVSGVVADSSIDADAMWSAFGTLGFKINQGTSVYGLIGLAGTDITYPGGMSIEPDGLLWGGGLELDLGYKAGDADVSLFFEYNHVDWNRSKDDMTTLRPDTDVFRVGARIKFNMPDITK